MRDDTLAGQDTECFMRTFLLTWTRTEVWSAAVGVLSLVLTVAGNLAPGTPRPTVIALCAFLVVVTVWCVFLVTRQAFVLTGYATVMSFLESLAQTAQNRLWTARTHLGEAGQEQPYFDIIEHRLKDPGKPLEDFRRVVRLGPRSRAHVEWLVEHFSQESNAEVRYLDAVGPQFDFVVVDGRIAVIGFPMVGGKNNIGAVVLRRRAAVEGVESVFISLWNDCKSNVLFDGSSGRTLEDVRQLQERVRGLVS
jgi:hypothetical protein